MAVNKHIIDVKTKGAKKSEKQIKGVSGALGGMAAKIGLAAGNKCLKIIINSICRTTISRS